MFFVTVKALINNFRQPLSKRESDLLNKILVGKPDELPLLRPPSIYYSLVVY